jgi:mono/diheme cytochrome c family protein
MINTKLQQSFRSIRAILSGTLLGFALQAGAAEPSPLFVRSCGSCHGLEGRADTKMARYLGVKDLTQSKLTEADIEQIIRHGVTAPDGRRRMPAFEESLSAEDVKAIAAAVKALQK